MSEGYHRDAAAAIISTAKPNLMIMWWCVITVCGQADEDDDDNRGQCGQAWLPHVGRHVSRDRSGEGRDTEVAL